MGDGLSIGKTWTIQVPDSGRTVSRNLWQYSLFPMATAPSVQYPCDSLSNLNDSALMRFDFDATNFLDTSTNMFCQLMPMVKQWMAQQAEIYQKTMESISGNTNINIKKTPKDEETETIDGKKVIKENEIISTITKMGTDSQTAERMNRKITYTNKEGKEIKDKTLLQRLIELSKEYQENPDKPETIEISKENYELLWDIAGKYAQTGELSRDDYAKLIEIATNPGGPGAYKKADEHDEEESQETIERSKNYTDGHVSKETNQATAQLFFDAMNGAGTNKGKMKGACESTDKYNVIEVIDKYNSINAYTNGGETWIEAVFDDCDNWGSGEGGKWYCLGMDDDDAKPYVDKLSYAMIERASDIQDLANCSTENKKELAEKVKALETALNAADASNTNHSNTDLSKEHKTAIINAFKNLFNAIKAAEKQVYGKEN